MEINIDEKVLAEALDQQAVVGIKNAFESYQIKRVIEETIVKSVMPELITTAVCKAASLVDTERLTQCIAEEITRSVVKGVQGTIRTAMVNIMLDMRKIPEYERDKREAARLEILHSVFK